MALTIGANIESSNIYKTMQSQSISRFNYEKALHTEERNYEKLSDETNAYFADDYVNSKINDARSQAIKAISNAYDVELRSKQESEKQQEGLEEVKYDRGQKQRQIMNSIENAKNQELINEGRRTVGQLQQKLNAGSQKSNSVAQALVSIQKILRVNSIINEDIKGIKVDLNY